MTNDELAAIERLLSFASDGPWSSDLSPDAPIKNAFGRIAERWRGGNYYEWKRNAAFICAARQAVPRLVAEVKRLRAELAQLKKSPGKAKAPAGGTTSAIGRFLPPPTKQKGFQC